MGTEQRPYVGTWNIQEKKVVQHTPDCLVYINGDLTIPSVDTKGQQYRIDLQKFITSVQVDCANNPSGSSASISVSIPTHSNEPIARDSNNILKVGLEVHIYMRGYFPVRGLFRGTGDNVAIYDDDGNLITGEISEDQISTTTLTNADFSETESGTATVKFPLEPGDLEIPQWVKDKANGINTKNDTGAKLTIDEITQWASEMGISVDMLVMAITLESESSPNKPDADFIVSSILNRMASDRYPNNAWEVVTNANGNVTVTGKQSERQNGNGRQYSTRQWYTLVNYDGSNNNGLTSALNRVYSVLNDRSNGEIYENTNFFHYGSQLALHNKEKASGGEIKHSHPSVVHNRWTRTMDFIEQSKDPNIRIYKSKSVDLSGFDFSAQAQALLGGTQSFTFTEYSTGDGTNRSRYVGQGDNYRPKTRYDDLYAYPYYHVFHGVVTNVSISYSPGVQTATLQCGSMLHFWSYQNMSTNAAAFGARPSNSKNRMSLLGHNFTGQHPYEIIYTLFHDTAGAAGAVSFVLDQKTNVDSVLGENSLYSLNIKYWEKRFSQRVMNLRLHGATGALFNTLQATAMAKINTDELQSAFSARNPRLGGQGASPKIMSGLRNLGLLEDRKRATQSADQEQQAQDQAQQSSQGQQVTQAQIDQASFGNSGGFKGGNPLDLNIFMMEAYVKDIGQIASINLFESSYETKMDIANKVCEITGFEFYQDVDGDCVFKPPMYNLDTSSSRVYRIEDIDMISWSETEKEPDVTFMITKGSQFANLAGTGVDGEWGVQGTFIDYPLVAKYGWRSGSFETAYFNDARQCFFASINRMAVMNASVNSANASIPIRPELRPGYPIYIPTYDCFYYCTSVSHQFQVGGACQTTLQLVAKRKKFYAPGDPNKSGIESIKLDGFAFPPKPLQILRKDGYSQLSGFPNVVMTLDPELINPMFFVSGADFESLTSEENLENLAKLLAQSSTDSNTFAYDENSKTLSWKQGDQTKYFKVGDDPSGVGNGSQSNPYNLFALAGKREEKRLSDKDKKYNSEYLKQKQILGGIEDSINKAREEKSSTPVGKEDGTDVEQRHFKVQQQLDKTIRDLRSKRRREQTKLDQMVQNAPQNSNSTVFTPSAKGLDYLIEMLSFVRRYGKYDSDRFNKDWTNLESSANLLDLIGNKKANLSNGQLPGSYRYYSSAHPNPQHQGKKLAYENSGANNEIATPKPQNAPLTTPKTAPQYVPTANITVPDQMYQLPEAELQENGQVLNGIPLIGADGDETVTPTDEIFSLRFQKVKGKVKRRKYVQLTDFKKGLLTEEDFVLGIRKQLGVNKVDGGTYSSLYQSISTATSSTTTIQRGSSSEIAYDTTLFDFYDEYVRYAFESFLETVDGFTSSKWDGFQIADLQNAIDNYYGTSTNGFIALNDIDTTSFFIGNYFAGNIDNNPVQSGFGYYTKTPVFNAVNPTIDLTSSKMGGVWQNILWEETATDSPTSDILLVGEREKIRTAFNNSTRFSAFSSPRRYFDLSGRGGDLSDLIVVYGSNDYCIDKGIGGFVSNGDTRKVTIGRYEYEELGYVAYNVSSNLAMMGNLSALNSTQFFFRDMYFLITEMMGKAYYQYWTELEDTYGRSSRTMKKIYKFVSKAFGLDRSLFSNRMANVWVWKDITTEVPVFPISDNKGYEVFGHYPYGRGLDIFANNPLDTILKTDPFIAVDRQTVENYVLSLQGKTVSVTNEDGSVSSLSGQQAITESTRQLEIALKNEYSPQELLDYGLATLNSENMLQISVQNWLADKSRDGVQKLTVENRAFSIADLGFLSDVASLPSDLKTSQSDVLLPAYSDNFADIVMGSGSNSATLLDQLLATTASGAPKTRDMIHSIVSQENRSPNWSASQSALRGNSLETQNSADIIRDTVDTLNQNFQQTIQQGVQAVNQALDSQQQATQNLNISGGVAEDSDRDTTSGSGENNNI